MTYLAKQQSPGEADVRTFFWRLFAHNPLDGCLVLQRLSEKHGKKHVDASQRYRNWRTHGIHGKVDRPNANLGLATGYYCLDADDEEIAAWIAFLVAIGNLPPPTYIQRTGRGFHYIYRKTGWWKYSAPKVGKLDFKDLAYTGIYVHGSWHPVAERHYELIHADHEAGELTLEALDEAFSSLEKMGNLSKSAKTPDRRRTMGPRGGPSFESRTDTNAVLLREGHKLYTAGARTWEALCCELIAYNPTLPKRDTRDRVEAVARNVVAYREELPSKPPPKFPPHMSRRGGVESGRTRRRRRGTAARNAEIVKLHGRGMSHRRIADMVGCGKSWVSKVVRESRTIREDAVVSPFTRTRIKAIKGSVDTPTRKAPKLVTTREEFESELKKLNDLEATRDEDLNSGHRSHIGRIRNRLWRSLFRLDEWWSLVFYRADDLTLAKPCHTPLVVVPERHGDWCSGLRKAA